MDPQQQKQFLKSTFDTVAPGYDNQPLRFFSNSAERLVEQLALKGDEAVLDVATGTGHTALAMAARLPGGRVTGIDFSAGMLERAREKAAALDIKNAEFLQMDMQALEFPQDHFDVVVCSFGIFFVDDMEAQLAQMAAVARPGGRVAITCFHEDHFFPPMVELLIKRLGACGIEPPAPTWKRIATAARIEEFLGTAGIDERQIRQEDVGYYLEDATEWWDVVWNGGFRRLVDRLEPGRLEEFRAEHLREIEALRTDEGIRLDVGVLIAAGVRP